MAYAKRFDLGMREALATRGLTVGRRDNQAKPVSDGPGSKYRRAWAAVRLTHYTYGPA
jgi:hypothetical protein